MERVLFRMRTNWLGMEPHILGRRVHGVELNHARTY